MTKKECEYRLLQLNLISCFNRIDTNISMAIKKREKMNEHYNLALEGLRKLNAKELDALNNVIEAINNKSI